MRLAVHLFFVIFLHFSLCIFQVSWVRRRGDELNLITFGRHTYSSDSRYSLEYQPPNDWALLIQYANERDEGHYECQVSSHPPLVLLVYLTVVGRYSHFCCCCFRFVFAVDIGIRTYIQHIANI